MMIKSNHCSCTPSTGSAPGHTTAWLHVSVTCIAGGHCEAPVRHSQTMHWTGSASSPSTGAEQAPSIQPNLTASKVVHNHCKHVLAAAESSAEIQESSTCKSHMDFSMGCITHQLYDNHTQTYLGIKSPAHAHACMAYSRCTLLL